MTDLSASLQARLAFLRNDTLSGHVRNVEISYLINHSGLVAHHSDYVESLPVMPSGVKQNWKERLLYPYPGGQANSALRKTNMYTEENSGYMSATRYEQDDLTDRFRS